MAHLRHGGRAVFSDLTVLAAGLVAIFGLYGALGVSLGVVDPLELPMGFLTVLDGLSPRAWALGLGLSVVGAVVFEALRTVLRPAVTNLAREPLPGRLALAALPLLGPALLTCREMRFRARVATMPATTGDSWRRSTETGVPWSRWWVALENRVEAFLQVIVLIALAHPALVRFPTVPWGAVWVGGLSLAALIALAIALGRLASDTGEAAGTGEASRSRRWIAWSLPVLAAIPLVGPVIASLALFSALPGWGASVQLASTLSRRSWSRATRSAATPGAGSLSPSPGSTASISITRGMSVLRDWLALRTGVWTALDMVFLVGLASVWLGDPTVDHAVVGWLISGGVLRVLFGVLVVSIVVGTGAPLVAVVGPALGWAPRTGARETLARAASIAWPATFWLLWAVVGLLLGAGLVRGPHPLELLVPMTILGGFGGFLGEHFRRVFTEHSHAGSSGGWRRMGKSFGVWAAPPFGLVVVCGVGHRVWGETGSQAALFAVAHGAVVTGLLTGPAMVAWMVRPWRIGPPGWSQVLAVVMTVMLALVLALPGGGLLGPWLLVLRHVRRARRLGRVRGMERPSLPADSESQPFAARRVSTQWTDRPGPDGRSPSP